MPLVLSNVFATATLVGPVPVCVIVPPRFVRSVALSVNWFASIEPPLLSSDAAFTVAVWPAAMLPDAFVRRAPALTIAFRPAASVPLPLSSDWLVTWRSLFAVTVPWLASTIAVDQAGLLGIDDGGRVVEDRARLLYVKLVVRVDGYPRPRGPRNVHLGQPALRLNDVRTGAGRGHDLAKHQRGRRSG
jgi:hypothetical protein